MADLIAGRSWSPSGPGVSPADRFLEAACLDFAADSPARRAAAASLLAAHPDLPSEDLAVAAVCADVAAVRAHLAGNPGAADRPCGPRAWSPLMYLAYGRFDVSAQDVVETVQLLLAAGADPDDGRFFGGLVPPFTVLTGVLGGGEQDQPPHPLWEPVTRVLLGAGADPNDGQALYNRMFTPDDGWLELLFEFGLGAGDGGPWRRLLPDLPPPGELLSDLLGWAVTHDQRARVRLLARRGVDLATPLRSRNTPVELALLTGHAELARELQELGSPPPALDPVAAFVAAALAGDAAAVAATPPDVVEAARSARPGLVVWAAGLQRPVAVELLVRAGFDVNARGRSDLPIEQPWETALHTAVERDDADLARLLLSHGADRQLRDGRFDGTPADWADHLGRPALRALVAD